jgi:hypothetical protein
MSMQPATDPLPHLAAVARALAAPDQPATLFGALQAATAATLGHKLFTILLRHPSGEVERHWTSQPEAYPVGGRKPPMRPTRWTEQVLDRKQPFIGYTAADIAEVFFDHALIASLGCDSVINIPVVFDDRVLGTINLLHQARWYGAEDGTLGAVFAALAVPGFLALTR